MIGPYLALVPRRVPIALHLVVKLGALRANANQEGSGVWASCVCEQELCEGVANTTPLINRERSGLGIRDRLFANVAGQKRNKLHAAPMP